MSDSRLQILLHLSDGKFHAGTVLAKKLGMSRAAVWKHIQHLQADGLPIKASRGKGYCLDYPVCLLDEASIRQHLNQRSCEPQIRILWQTTSTNDQLKRTVDEKLRSGVVCIAEQQTAGRGTRGRQWLSPPGVNIYLSFYWQFERAASELSGLSLAVAIALAQALASRGQQEIMIKWPNDLHTAKGKLGGILIDMLAETNGPTRAIIGVGLNMGMPAEHAAVLDQAIDDLCWQQAALALDRNQLAAMIIDTLYECCEIYDAQGFLAYHKQWPRWDMLEGKAVTLQKGLTTIEGTASGIDETGALLLLTAQGKTSHASGDVSLRVKPV